MFSWCHCHNSWPFFLLDSLLLLYFLYYIHYKNYLSLPRYLLLYNSFSSLFFHTIFSYLPKISTILHLNSPIFSFSFLPNFFFISSKNSSTILYFYNPSSNFSNIFSFHISINPSYTYDKAHRIYSSTSTPFIFFPIYALHSSTKPNTFDKVSLNTWGNLAPYASTTPPPVNIWS